MLKILMIGLLLLYYWYFYFSYPESVTASGSPVPPAPYQVSFVSSQRDRFRFLVNGAVAWEHRFPDHSYMAHSGKIVQRDACYGIPHGHSIAARGQRLYDYLKEHPEIKTESFFLVNTPFTVQHGNAFYFTCMNHRIQSLDLCPSGTLFSNGRCQPISACTNLPDGTNLPHPNVTQFIQCKNGREFTKNCPSDTFFHHDRCTSKMNLNHYCKFFADKPFRLDDETRVVCEGERPTYVRCEPGTRFFEKDYCEPADCVGLQDGTRKALPHQFRDPFHFSPGYLTCRHGKVAETVECAETWDLSKGDDLPFLPMVFDGRECTFPVYCENVFSDDPEVMVPVHEFTKDVKNWEWSERYDRMAGYACEGRKRKRRLLAPDMRIGKRFKPEPACEPGLKLPALEAPGHYYDCDRKTLVTCPQNHYFDGTACAPEPENAFRYKGVPLFRFDHLNSEGWIQPWDYSNEPPVACAAGTENLQLYNICSHPDCSPYAFLSMIPDLAILLPEDGKCRYDERERLLKKEAVDLEYSFWDQRPLREDEEDDEPCTPGQNLRTGHFVWDRSVFATCDLNEPFVFCPSVLTQGLIVERGKYACAPPDTNEVFFNSADWTSFMTNEVKRILPVYLGGTSVKLNKSEKDYTPLPDEGLEIPLHKRLTLQITRSVKLELRYRVTHPPHRAFKYEDERELMTGTKGQGYIVKVPNFTTKSLKFPTYKIEKFVDSFQV